MGSAEFPRYLSHKSSRSQGQSFSILVQELNQRSPGRFITLTGIHPLSGKTVSGLMNNEYVMSEHHRGVFRCLTGLKQKLERQHNERFHRSLQSEQH